MFNFIKKTLFGVQTVTTDNIEIYKYDEDKRELIISSGPTVYPAHLIIKDNLIFLYVDKEMINIIEAKMYASNYKSMGNLMSKALGTPTSIYEILGYEKRAGLKMFRVQKVGTATRMEIHVSNKYFSIHSDYDHDVKQYKSVSQFSHN